MSKKNKAKVKILLLESYLAAIKNSVGSKTYRSLLAEINGKKIDIAGNGSYSCALFASSILFVFKLIKDMHATVNSLAKDLETFGWQEIKNPKIGSILIWDEIYDNKSGKVHKHAGFYIGNNKAISNSEAKKSPQIHHLTYGERNGQPVRKITKIFWHKKLDS
ncbi:MAG: hypothetical protein CEN90_276 [Parcubacteria group bacterium Licking1014_17]|nr:MAG: hypothetical protein CEN90_276 [Parcubacteria group bacterium Licking1014_17]